MSSQTVQYRVILMCLFMGMGGKRRLRLGGGVGGGVGLLFMVCHLVLGARYYLDVALSPTPFTILIYFILLYFVFLYLTYFIFLCTY